MTEPSKLVQKAIGRSNTTWKSIKQRAVACVGAYASIPCGTQMTTRDLVYPDLKPVPASTSTIHNCYKGHFLNKFSCDVSVV